MFIDKLVEISVWQPQTHIICSAKFSWNYELFFSKSFWWLL